MLEMLIVMGVVALGCFIVSTVLGVYGMVWYYYTFKDVFKGMNDSVKDLTVSEF